MTGSALPPALAMVLQMLSPVDLDGAACAGRAPEFDDHLDGESDDQRDARHAAAVALCRHCPVIDGCRRVAVALPHASGIWAAQEWPVRPARRHTRGAESAVERVAGFGRVPAPDRRAQTA